MYVPLYSLTLADPRPRMRSHMRSVRSCPTESASFPDGWTATAFTRPLCPRSARSTDQSRARKIASVPSSDAERRCVREGKLRCVTEPAWSVSVS